MLPETARCCSDRVFYNTLLTFPGLGQTKVNLPFMLQHRFLARRASFRLRFRPCWYKDFFKGKGVPPTAHPALSRQRLRSGFVFLPRVRSGFVLIVRPILRQRTDAISLNLWTGSLCIQPYIYIYAYIIYRKYVALRPFVSRCLTFSSVQRLFIFRGFKTYSRASH